MVYDFDRIINTIKNSTADIDVKKKVYFERSDFTAMGAGTGYNEMLELANATNAAAKLNIPYPTVSTEWLLEENPDVIIKIITADTITVEMYDNLVNRAGWNRLDAVKNGRVYLISNDISSGPRAMIGSLYIGKWCYPERFTAVNPDSVHLHWMRKYYGVASLDNFVFTFNMPQK
jgi:iron complex transport system substrate-binding protein